MNDARLLKLLQALLSTPEPIAGTPPRAGPSARTIAREALTAAMLEDGQKLVVREHLPPQEEPEVARDATLAILRTIDAGALQSPAAIGGVLRKAIRRGAINARRDRGWLFWEQTVGTHLGGEARDPLDDIATQEPATDRAAHLPDLGAVILCYPTMPENYRRALRRWYAEQEADERLPSIEEEVLTEVVRERRPLEIARTPSAVIEGEVARRVAPPPRWLPLRPPALYRRTALRRPRRGRRPLPRAARRPRPPLPVDREDARQRPRRQRRPERR